MNKEIVIEAFDELRDESQKITNHSTLTDWKNKAINVVRRVYGIDSSQEQQIRNMKYYPGFSKGDPDNIPSLKKQCSSLFEGLSKEIQRFDVPEKLKETENQNFHFNILQTQSQKTKVDLNFIIESIQEELKGSELREIQEIIDDANIEPEKKKNKIVETLKKFGSDVATNIVANIFTNPNIYGV